MLSTTVEITIGYLTQKYDGYEPASTTVEITIGYLTSFETSSWSLNLQQ